MPFQHAIQAKTQAELDRAAALMPVHRCGRHLRYEERRYRLARPCSWLARLPVHAAALTRGSAPCTVTSVHSSYCEAW